jgi:hypothetical protein
MSVANRMGEQPAVKPSTWANFRQLYVKAKRPLLASGSESIFLLRYASNAEGGHNEDSRLLLHLLAA